MFVLWRVAGRQNAKAWVGIGRDSVVIWKWMTRANVGFDFEGRIIDIPFFFFHVFYYFSN